MLIINIIKTHTLHNKLIRIQSDFFYTLREFGRHRLSQLVRAWSYHHHRGFDPRTGHLYSLRFLSTENL